MSDRDVLASRTGIPVVDLKFADDDAEVLLRRLQAAVIQHPAAAQAIFNSLVAEGKKFADTPEGSVWKTKLQKSRLVQAARLVFDLATLSLLEEDRDAILPSTYLDILFMLASSGRSDAVLDRLFTASAEDEHATP